ncbi:unnamed protein product [Rotaria socialis]|uniref:Acid phosphatase n=1 Tax=Rotaria socialis TaxID=392032 RepID=A0A818H3F6_9BILA|nr:unnamed protein product [Rotaria socialis]CAF3313724.1 unnamed protein product [Rotaria socialis]CAF3357391.1 unnamed protein product [Rotaria socialis]CAF3497885.1 unnamed protein product [Rotaria socialis]CAF3603666.1 unnamed protein product [Rotaria socialis]
MIGIGNHEYDHVTGGNKDPSQAPGDGGFRPIWGNYGYDSGGECAVPMANQPVHVVYYSTEHDFRRSSPQYKWLEQDLRSIDRIRTPWLIVTSHRPMYSSLIGIDLIQIMLQLYIEPLLYKYHVDLNLYGHIHSYERTCPMYQHKCIDDGITQVLIGMGGHDLTYGSYSNVDWSVYHDIYFGYTHINVNKTHLTFSYYHTEDDKLIDQFQLKKQ